MAKKVFRAESKKDKNKRLATRLLFSLVVILAIYFGCVRAGYYQIIYVYIALSFVLAVSYSYVKIKAKTLFDSQDKEHPDKAVTEKIKKLDGTGKNLIILFLPMIIAMLADYLLIATGLAGYLNI